MCTSRRGRSSTPTRRPRAGAGGHGGGGRRRHPRGPRQAAPDRAVAASGLIHVFTLSGAHPEAARGSRCSTSSAGSAPATAPTGRMPPGLLPRRPLGHPPDRAAGGPVPVHRRDVAAATRLRRTGRMAGRPRRRVGMLSDAELTVRGDRMGLRRPGAGRRSRVRASFWSSGPTAAGAAGPQADRVPLVAATSSSCAPRAEADSAGADRQPDLVRRRRANGRVAEGAARDYGVLQ